MLHCIVQCEPYVFLLFFMILSMGNQIQMDTFITMFEIPFVSLEISSLRQKTKQKKPHFYIPVDKTLHRSPLEVTQSPVIFSWLKKVMSFLNVEKLNR